MEDTSRNMVKYNNYFNTTITESMDSTAS